MVTPPETPTTRFDWAIYADATFAGLSILVPLPLLDVFLEWLFRRRMPQAIARRNGRQLNPAVADTLNGNQFSFLGCLTWPLALLLLLLRRLYRTVLYFLTVKDASDKLGYYWHRAFLLDYMVRRGDLADEQAAAVAVAALNEVLDTLTTNPLTQLALEIVAGARHIGRTIWRWLRRRQEDEVVIHTRQQMDTAWSGLAGYLQEVAAQYEAARHRLAHEQLPGPAA